MYCHKAYEKYNRKFIRQREKSRRQKTQWFHSKLHKKTAAPTATAAGSSQAVNARGLFNSAVLPQFPTMRYPLPPFSRARRPSVPPSGRWRHLCGGFTFSRFRHDLRHLNVYALDPEGCKIIDDGFSIEPRPAASGGGTLLHVHVADPTCYFSPSDEVFSCALSNGTSYYPSGRRARQMLDPATAAMASLSGGARRAITLTYHFAPGDVLLRVECRMTNIYCDNRFHFSYTNAGKALKAGHRVLRSACRLAAAVRAQQSGVIFFGSMDHLSLSCPRVVVGNRSDRVQLFRNGPHVIRVKEMVSVLAVATNGNVARLLEAGTSPPPVVVALLDRGCGTNMPYVHFTSPLRRACDCVVHFELKNILARCPKATLWSDQSARPTKLPPVFSGARAHALVKSARIVQKRSRKLQRLNLRTRFVQYIHQRLHTDGARRVVLRFCRCRVTALRARLLVTSLDGHPVRFVYDVYPGPGQAVNPATYCDAITQSPERDASGAEQTVHVTCCTQKADQYGYGALPQIDALFLVQENVQPTNISGTN